MKSQRLKSIDIFRGLCMSWMVLAHLIDWWLKSEYNWLHKARKLRRKYREIIIKGFK